LCVSEKAKLKKQTKDVRCGSVKPKLLAIRRGSSYTSDGVQSPRDYSSAEDDRIGGGGHQMFCSKNPIPTAQPTY
jgi:hypothetical protein